MFAGTLTVRPSESVNSTVAPDDAEAEADAEAAEADPDPDALEAALELDEDPHPASPRTTAKHSAKQHATIAFLDFKIFLPFCMIPLTPLLIYRETVYSVSSLFILIHSFSFE